MQIRTTHFGMVQIASSDLFRFPHGLIGFEDCLEWVLLADQSNESVGWLQSASHESLALPVISPRRFVADYRLRVRREQLGVLQLAEHEKLFILSIVAKNGGVLTANLRAPVLINLDRRLGCQMVVAEDQAVQHPLAQVRLPLRKSA